MNPRPNRHSCSPQKGSPFRGVRSPSRQHAVRRCVDLDPLLEPGGHAAQAHGAEGVNPAHLRFLAVVASLPGPERKAVELAFFDGLTVAEIAAQMGMSAAAAQKILESGLKTVAHAMGEQTDDL